MDSEEGRMAGLLLLYKH